MSGSGCNKGSYRYIHKGHCGPWRGLACGIIKQACDDVKRLQGAGVIREGKSISLDQWPLHGGKNTTKGVYKRFQGYRRPSEVDNLLRFFENRGVCDNMLDLMGMKVKARDVRRGLGL